MSKALHTLLAILWLAGVVLFPLEAFAEPSPKKKAPDNQAVLDVLPGTGDSLGIRPVIKEFGLTFTRIVIDHQTPQDPINVLVRFELPRMKSCPPGGSSRSSLRSGGDLAVGARVGRLPAHERLGSQSVPRQDRRLPGRRLLQSLTNSLLLTVPRQYRGRTRRGASLPISGFPGSVVRNRSQPALLVEIVEGPKTRFARS
ncbi:MAG: hypothetical protein D084_Lepto4C00308G0003 [Leptospirillum sp. Group IV 'UBA BS']|nr:MAG: hypothetical protein D084_Lepto4C00308G0003 [Leptospirillum sp. Group IV 'UBA BS']